MAAAARSVASLTRETHCEPASVPAHMRAALASTGRGSAWHAKGHRRDHASHRYAAPGLSLGQRDLGTCIIARAVSAGGSAFGQKPRSCTTGSSRRRFSGPSIARPVTAHVEPAARSRKAALAGGRKARSYALRAPESAARRGDVTRRTALSRWSIAAGGDGAGSGSLVCGFPGWIGMGGWARDHDTLPGASRMTLPLVLAGHGRAGELAGPKGLVGVEQWAELRREHFVRGASVKQLAGRTGLSRNTVRAALHAPAPPRYQRASGWAVIGAKGRTTEGSGGADVVASAHLESCPWTAIGYLRHSVAR